MDVVTAFFYGFWDENIFVNQPEGYLIDTVLVYHLRKALYGLKQALFVWYTLILEFLQKLGFAKTNSDHKVFLSYDKSTVIPVDMDDLLIIGEDLKIIKGLKNKVSDRFHITDLVSSYHYLGMSVTRTGGSVSWDGKSYLEKVLLQFEIDICKPASLSMDPGDFNSMLPAPENQQADKDTSFDTDLFLACWCMPLLWPGCILETYYLWLIDTEQAPILLTLQHLYEFWDIYAVRYITVLYIPKVNRDLWVTPMKTGNVLLMDDSQLVDDCLWLEAHLFPWVARVKCQLVSLVVSSNTTRWVKPGRRGCGCICYFKNYVTFLQLQRLSEPTIKVRLLWPRTWNFTKVRSILIRSSIGFEKSLSEVYCFWNFFQSNLWPRANSQNLFFESSFSVFWQWWV